MRISEQLKEQEEEEEEEENKEKKVEHIIRHFNENVSKLSNIIKNIDISCFDENAFTISKENKLVEFSQILIITDTGTWTFIYGSIEFFSALFSKVPNMVQWINFYLVLVNEFGKFYYDEWPIPVTSAISCRPELIDQEFIDHIFNVSKDYIEESIINYGEKKLIDTVCFLYINSLITRLFEISEDVFSSI